MKTYFLLLVISWAIVGCNPSNSSSDEAIIELFESYIRESNDLIKEEIHRRDNNSDDIMIDIDWVYEFSPAVSSVGVSILLTQDQTNFKWKVRAIGFDDIDKIPKAKREQLLERLNRVLEAQ